MKKWILFLINFTVIYSFASTYHSIPMNGQNVFSSDENFITSTDGYEVYCSWDEANLYLAYSGEFLASPSDTVRGTTDMFFYIDTDPDPEIPLASEGTSHPANYYTNIMEQQPFWFDEQAWSLPFNADYFVKGEYVKKDSIYGTYGPYDEETALWEFIDLDTSLSNLNLDLGYYEIAIPWDSLGNPEQIFIVGWLVSNEWLSEIYYNPLPSRDVGGSYGSWPAHSLEGGDGDKNSDGQFNYWFSFTITSGVSPDAANGAPVLSPILSQTISTGEEFTVIDLNTHVFDDLTIDEEIVWTTETEDELSVAIDTNNQATINLPYPDWTGTETINFIATDAGGLMDSTSTVFTVTGVSAIDSDISEIPSEFSLAQNYPNPFNPDTYIEFSLPQATSVDIEIFNILGQPVFKQHESHLEAGIHRLQFKANYLNSGTYFYRVSSGGKTLIKKMTLLK